MTGHVECRHRNYFLKKFLEVKNMHYRKSAMGGINKRFGIAEEKSNRESNDKTIIKN